MDQAEYFDLGGTERRQVSTIDKMKKRQEIGGSCRESRPDVFFSTTVSIVNPNVTAERTYNRARANMQLKLNRHQRGYDMEYGIIRKLADNYLRECL